MIFMFLIKFSRIVSSAWRPLSCMVRAKGREGLGAPGLRAPAWGFNLKRLLKRRFNPILHKS